MNIIVGILDQCDTDTKIDLIKYSRSVTYIYGPVILLHILKTYLMEKCCTWDNGSV